MRPRRDDMGVPAVNDDVPYRLARWPRSVARQYVDAPGNALTTIDQYGSRAESGSQFVGNQRKMGAGQSHCVDLVAKGLVSQRCHCGFDRRRINGFAAQLCLGHFDKIRRAQPDDAAIDGMVGNQPVDIGLANRCRSAEDANNAAPAGEGGWLDGRNGPHKGGVQCRADMGEGDGARCVAGDDNQSRPEPFDQPAEQGGYPRPDLRLAFFAVWKTAIVGRINDRRFRYQRERGGQNAEAAKPTVEKNDG